MLAKTCNTGAEGYWLHRASEFSFHYDSVCMIGYIVNIKFMLGRTISQCEIQSVCLANSQSLGHFLWNRGKCYALMQQFQSDRYIVVV